MNGDIWLGPNAVLAFKREGYRLTDVDAKDFVDAVGYSGLRKLALRNLKFGIGEMYRGFHVAAQVIPPTCFLLLPALISSFSFPPFFLKYPYTLRSIPSAVCKC